MANLSAAAYAKKHARTGDRIARRAARLRNTSAKQQGFIPSTGPSLASQIASALKRPGVVATGRPTTAEGVSAFHFSVRPITKGSEATALAGGTARPGASGAHQRYLEREGAAEKTLADIDVDHFAAEQQQYIEREAAAEHVLASFGNISPLYEERMEFWRLAEEFARTPRTHVMTFNPGHDAEFWKAVDTLALNAPEQLIEAARDRSTELTVDDRTAAAILTFFKTHQSPGNEKTPAVAIEIGRGGRIQTRIIAELPHEVSAEKRMQIAREFCEARIANIEPPDADGPYEGKKKTLRYWAVIHAPDDHNDNRNNHLHVVFYDRPTDKMLDDATGTMQWDFAITKTTTDKHWNKRTQRPHERPRGRVTTKKEWTVQSRAYFAKLVNAALEEAGVKRRIDARSYKDIGIDEKPIPRMEPKAYQKEKQGTPTNAGEQTIAAQWDRELKRISALYDAVVFDNAVVAKFNATADRFKTKLRTSAAEVEKTFDEWAKAVVDKRGALAERAAVLFNIAKIRSRLTPPLDHRPKAEIAATKAVIDELQKDELAPLNRLYRAALVKEKTALTALGKLERAYSGTSQTAAVAPAVTTPPATANKGVMPPPAPGRQPPSQTKAATAAINAAPQPSMAPPVRSKPATPIQPTAPTVASKPAQRPSYGSIPGLGDFTPKFKPAPKLDPALDEATLAQMQAERTRQHDEAIRIRHERHLAYVGPLMKAIEDMTKRAISGPNIKTIDDVRKVVDVIAAENKAKQKKDEENDAAEQAIFDAELRLQLSIGIPLPDGPDVSAASRQLITSRLDVIAREDAGTKLGAIASAVLAARKAGPSQTPQQDPISPSAAAAKPPQTRPAAAQPPAAQSPPTVATPTPAVIKTAETNAAAAKETAAKTAETTASGAKAADAKTVEPQPGAVPPSGASPQAPLAAQRANLYRRRTRQLTPEERSALTKPHFTSKAQPKDDTPETMPAHAQRRRPALHDEPPRDNATPNASTSAAPPPAAPRAPLASAPKADIPPAADITAATTPAPARAPEPNTQQPATTTAEAAKPEAAPTTATEPSPPAVGPTIDIAALPEAKKRKKKKVSELSAEGRRRIFIARQEMRGHPER